MLNSVLGFWASCHGREASRGTDHYLVDSLHSAFGEFHLHMAREEIRSQSQRDSQRYMLQEWRGFSVSRQRADAVPFEYTDKLLMFSLLVSKFLACYLPMFDPRRSLNPDWPWIHVEIPLCSAQAGNQVPFSHSVCITVFAYRLRAKWSIHKYEKYYHMNNTGQ